MKYITFIFAVFLFASPLLAQTPSIYYLMCDEAKSQLQIHGSFGIDSGSVAIEDTTLGIASWSDSLIICNLPDSGKGAGGNIQVQTKNGVSNKRILSIFNVRVDHPVWAWNHPGSGQWFSPYARTWVVTWRIDISARPLNLQQTIRFEASKFSYGVWSGLKWPYYDSTIYFDHGVTFWGVVDLNKHQIDFGQEKFKFGPPETPDSIYTPLSIKFDTTGSISGYTDIHIGDPNNPSDQQKTDSLYNQNILFPPGQKNTVALHIQPPDPIRIWFENNLLILQCQSPLGSSTASLYSIDGRLLKRTKLDISSPGEYSIDVSDVREHFAILVLQTEKGVITKKILL